MAKFTAADLARADAEVRTAEMEVEMQRSRLSSVSFDDISREFAEGTLRQAELTVLVLKAHRTIVFDDLKGHDAD